jgi:hypothetical protein
MSWVDRRRYYDEYKQLATDAGVTPLVEREWYNKYMLMEPGNNGSEDLTRGRENFQKEFTKIWKDKHDAIADQYATYAGTTPDYYSGSNTDATAAKDSYESLNKQYQFVQNDPTAIANKKTRDDALKEYKPTEAVQNIVDEMTTASNAADATTPTYNYTGGNTDAYYQNIKDSEQKGTNEAVKAVNETANFVNPYATGSGSQLKAVSTMMDNITANQQARAFSLGQNNYNMNYTQDVATAEKTNAKKTSAQNFLLGLPEYYNKLKKMDSADADAYMSLLKTSSTNALNSQIEAKKDANITALMNEYARLSQKQSTDWWQPFATTALTAVGTAVGGPIGGALAGTIASAFTPQQ